MIFGISGLYFLEIDFVKSTIFALQSMLLIIYWRASSGPRPSDDSLGMDHFCVFFFYYCCFALSIPYAVFLKAVALRRMAVVLWKMVVVFQVVAVQFHDLIALRRYFSPLKQHFFCLSFVFWIDDEKTQRFILNILYSKKRIIKQRSVEITSDPLYH